MEKTTIGFEQTLEFAEIPVSPASPVYISTFGIRNVNINSEADIRDKSHANMKIAAATATRAKNVTGRSRIYEAGLVGSSGSCECIFDINTPQSTAIASLDLHKRDAAEAEMRYRPLGEGSTKEEMEARVIISSRGNVVPYDDFYTISVNFTVTGDLDLSVQT